ncbi:unnamed protein product [Citrullus colocynthis]|uniref:Disease resistance N-terminal domain-containing protein n=1 Tax=Citrullus colocynthis TaxID=252529 RepID=A0ABP0YX51_9ROSI
MNLDAETFHVWQWTLFLSSIANFGEWKKITMAEFLWTFAVQEVLKKTVKLAAEQIGMGWGFKKGLSKMRDSLLMVQAILRDIDRIKSEYPDVKPWVEKLEDIVFEADILLDELAYEDLRRKV